MKLTSIPQLARNANRVREIVTILGRYGLADWIDRLGLDFARGFFRGGTENEALAKLTHERRIRLVLTELGTTFVKLGQVLSTRGDLIGVKLAEELTALQANAPADPPDVVRRAVEEELGRPVAELFAEFEDRPIASASVGQVHRARLPGGEAVVVKVQHPHIENRVRTDLEILLSLAELAEKHVPEIRQYQPRATAVQFQRTLLRELNFGREERNLQQFAANFAGESGVRFPKPYPEYSTGRVLTMDYLEGTPLSDPARLREQGFDLDEIARRGATVFLDMIFRDGFFHADPHPGNVLILSGGVIGMLDCGMVGRLDDRLREAIEEMLLAVVTRDADQLTSLITRLGAVPPALDQAGLNADIADFMAYHASRPLEQFDLSGALTELTEIIRRYHILLPAGVAMLLKVLVMLEGTARLVSPRFNLTQLIQPYQKKLVWRRLSPERHARKLMRLFQDWEALAEILPAGLREVLRKVQGGQFTIHLEHRNLESSVNRLVFGLITAALFVGSAVMWAKEAQPALFGISIPGLIGCGVSVGLASRLLWAIWRSGRLDRKRE
jgi:ubiquinone biosynthesis protein